MGLLLFTLSILVVVSIIGIAMISFRIAIQSLKRVNELEQTKTKKTKHV